MSYFKTLKWEMILFSLGCVAMGAILYFYPKSSTTFLSGVATAILFIYAIRHFIEFFRRTGMEKVYRYELVMGIVFTLLGIFTLTQMDMILSFISYIIAVIVFISGLMKIENAIDLKRMKRHWIIMIIIGILYIILSIIIFIAPMNNDTGKASAGEIVLITCGAVLMLVGAINFITTLIISSNINKWTKEQSQNTQTIDVDYEEVDK